MSPNRALSDYSQHDMSVKYKKGLTVMQLRCPCPVCLHTVQVTVTGSVCMCLLVYDWVTNHARCQ